MNINLLLFRRIGFLSISFLFTITINILPQEITFRESRPGEYTFNYFGYYNELCHAITCLHQDKKGFIWIGTEKGLYRYNGYELERTYHMKGGTRITYSNMIVAIAEDHGGNLWVGTQNGLFRVDNNTGINTHFRNEPDNPQSISSNWINDLHLDLDNTLWIATNEQGVNQLTLDSSLLYCSDTSILKDKTKFTRFVYDPENPDSKPNNTISSLLKEDDQTLWTGTLNGLGRLDVNTGEFKYLDVEIILPENKKYIDKSGVTSILKDRSGIFWIGTAEGFYHFDPVHYTFSNITIPGLSIEKISNEKWSFYEDRAGNIWLLAGSYHKIYKFTPGENNYQFIHFKTKNPSTQHLGFIKSMLEDKSGLFWLGTSDDGIYIYNPNQPEFQSIDLLSLSTGITQHHGVFSLCEDNTGNLWIGARIWLDNNRYSKPLIKLNRETMDYKFYDVPQVYHSDVRIESISNMAPDQSGKIWMAPGYNGLLLFNPETSDYKSFLNDPAKDTSYMDYYPRSIFVDQSGAVWIALWGGGAVKFFYNPDNEETYFVNYYHDPGIPGSLSSNNVLTIHQDRTGNIWIGTEEGLNLLKEPDHQNRIQRLRTPGKFVHFFRDPNNMNSISGDMITAIYADHENNLWIGTDGYGLNKINLEQDIVKRYSIKGSDKAYSVNSILEDNTGNLWFTSDYGLVRFSPDNESFKIYGVKDGLYARSFILQSYFKSKSGELFFGGFHGFISFKPDDIKCDTLKPPIYLTDIRLSNQSLSPGNDSPLKQSIENTRSIEFRHDENFVSIEFTSLDYHNTELNQFKYRMTGVDPDTVYAGTKRYAEYRNLRPGKYTFWVTGSNSDGVWNEAGTSLQIRITPPPWRKWWAYAIYGLILIGILFWYRRFQANRAKLRTALQIEKIEKEKIQELDQMKSRFFANISHEFRTPLTLLLGPIEDLLKKKPVIEDLDWDLFRVMQRNAKRLQRLINQLLDLSKVETGNIKLQVAEGNLTEFVKRIVLSFLSLAESKHIQYEFDISGLSVQDYFDTDKLEKILINLISNAFKFTPEKGWIKVTMKYIIPEKGSHPKHVKFIISDSGKGISADQLDKIFNRFYQVSSSDTREEGTGIGLSHTKELVDLYRGEISVRSEPGKGSIFIVKLPVSRDLFHEEELTTAPLEEPVMSDSYESVFSGPDESKILEIQGADKDREIILIVEDNIDLRKYIANNLNYSFGIMEAENGRIGLDRAIETIPDLVISDLMMPEMDGMEMCETLKADERTSHIPVIMLTAKADRESKLEGLESGADDYIIKPFDSEELQIRVSNLIKQRKALRDRYRKEFLTGGKSFKTTPPEEKFLKKVTECIQNNIGDQEYNIESMSREIGLSRSQLYRKILATTGFTPTEYLRNIRLKNAARILREGKHNIAQVAYNVGFGNPSYFSESFKELFGSTPSDYAKKK